MGGEVHGRLAELLAGGHDADHHCVAVLLHAGHRPVVEVGAEERLLIISQHQGVLVNPEGLSQRAVR